MSRGFLGFFVVISLACGGDGAGAPDAPGARQMWDHVLWSELPAAQDPFPDRPMDAACGPGGTKIEGTTETWLEVETDICKYVTLEQPSLVAIGAGEVVEITAWHQDLYAAAPAEAHIAIMLGDDVIWERSIPIPGDPAVYTPTWTADQPVPAGTPVRFHLHNHGQNSWRLGAGKVMGNGG